MGVFFKALLSFLSLAVCSTSAASLSQDRKPTIAFQPGNGSYLLATRSSAVNLLLDAADWPGVLRAANDLAVDFGRVTGTNGTLTTIGSGTANASVIFNVTGISQDWSIGQAGNGTLSHTVTGKGTIIAGTIGNSSLIDALVKSGKLDVSAIEGKWEAYVSAVVKNPGNGTDEALVIAGKPVHPRNVQLTKQWQEVTNAARSTAFTMSLSRSVSLRGIGSPMFRPNHAPAYTRFEAQRRRNPLP
jgi:hypothetical protein